MIRRNIAEEAIRVLLVDDEIDFTSTLSKRLGRRGMTVSTAMDGAEAYSLLDASSFDVVVLDMNMPVMDGLQTLRAIKKRFHEVEVIILSGAGSMQDAMKSAHAGAFDFLLKPAETGVLSSRIQDAAMSGRA